MKKILAIILSIAMLFGVLAINTSAEELPTVTLVTNEGSPVKAGDTTYFTVKFENYDSIKAFDVTITVPKAITIGEITATGLEANGAHKDTNYTIKDNVVRFVDLTTTNNQPKITFAATVADGTTESPVITVSGEYATSGTSKADFVDGAEGTFEIKKDVVSETVEIPENETSVTIEQPKAEAGQEKPTKFIPYGSVYKKVDGKYVFAAKDKETGSFAVTEEGYEVKSFDIPENGITTYGISENTADSSVIRFGNYTNTYNSNAEYGTLVFEGNWVALKNYYIQKGYTVAQLVKAICEKYDDTLAKVQGAEYIYYKVPTDEGTATVNVYRFKQKNHMWMSSDGTVLEYALRVSGLTESETYTGVAYSKLDSKITVSEKVQSVVKETKTQ